MTSKERTEMIKELVEEYNTLSEIQKSIFVQMCRIALEADREVRKATKTKITDRK